MQITVVNQYTKWIRLASSLAGFGSHGINTATSDVMTAAIAAMPSSWKIEPLRTRRNTNHTQGSRGRNRTTALDVELVSQGESNRPSGDTRRRFEMGIGVILMIVGAIGLVLSLMFWSSWGGVSGARRTTTTYVDDGPRV